LATGREWLSSKIKQIVYLSLLSALLLIAISLQSTARAECIHGTAGQAKAMVERAVDLVQEAGLNSAFNTFWNPEGDFLKGNLYIFAIHFDGTLLVNTFWPPSIGGNVLTARDPQERLYVQEMIRIAREHGEGWVQYEFIDPCTGESSPKSSFIKRVDEFLIGAGYYGAIAT
jgi:hypothetical protein